MKELELNLHDANDIITYAELLKQEIQQISLLRFCCEVQNGNENKLNVFEGDIFNTHDKYWGDKSNVYVAQKNETFKKLLYIKGKGYLRSGELNFDEGSYNSYVIKLDSFEKVGNIHTDLVMLTDDGDLIN